MVAAFSLKWQNMVDEMHGFYERPVQIFTEVTAECSLIVP